MAEYRPTYSQMVGGYVLTPHYCPQCAAFMLPVVTQAAFSDKTSHIVWSCATHG